MADAEQKPRRSNSLKRAYKKTKKVLKKLNSRIADNFSVRGSVADPKEVRELHDTTTDESYTTWEVSRTASVEAASSSCETPRLKAPPSPAAIKHEELPTEQVHVPPDVSADQHAAAVIPPIRSIANAKDVPTAAVAVGFAKHVPTENVAPAMVVAKQVPTAADSVVCLSTKPGVMATDTHRDVDVSIAERVSDAGGVAITAGTYKAYAGNVMPLVEGQRTVSLDDTAFSGFRSPSSAYELELLMPKMHVDSLTPNGDAGSINSEEDGELTLKGIAVPGLNSLPPPSSFADEMVVVGNASTPHDRKVNPAHDSAFAAFRSSSSEYEMDDSVPLAQAPIQPTHNSALACAEDGDDAPTVDGDHTAARAATVGQAETAVTPPAVQAQAVNAPAEQADAVQAQAVNAPAEQTDAVQAQAAKASAEQAVADSKVCIVAEYHHAANATEKVTGDVQPSIPQQAAAAALNDEVVSVEPRKAESLLVTPSAAVNPPVSPKHAEEVHKVTYADAVAPTKQPTGIDAAREDAHANSVHVTSALGPQLGNPSADEVLRKEAVTAVQQQRITALPADKVVGDGTSTTAAPKTVQETSRPQELTHEMPALTAKSMDSGGIPSSCPESMAALRCTTPPADVHISTGMCSAAAAADLSAVLSAAQLEVPVETAEQPSSKEDVQDVEERATPHSSNTEVVQTVLQDVSERTLLTDPTAALSTVDEEVYEDNISDAPRDSDTSDAAAKLMVQEACVGQYDAQGLVTASNVTLDDAVSKKPDVSAVKTVIAEATVADEGLLPQHGGLSTIAEDDVDLRAAQVSISIAAARTADESNTSNKVPLEDIMATAQDTHSKCLTSKEVLHFDGTSAAHEMPDLIPALHYQVVESSGTEVIAFAGKYPEQFPVILGPAPVTRDVASQDATLPLGSEDHLQACDQPAGQCTAKEAPADDKLAKPCSSLLAAPPAALISPESNDDEPPTSRKMLNAPPAAVERAAVEMADEFVRPQTVTAGPAAVLSSCTPAPVVVHAAVKKAGEVALYVPKTATAEPAVFLPSAESVCNEVAPRQAAPAKQAVSTITEAPVKQAAVSTITESECSDDSNDSAFVWVHSDTRPAGDAQSTGPASKVKKATPSLKSDAVGGALGAPRNIVGVCSGHTDKISMNHSISDQIIEVQGVNAAALADSGKAATAIQSEAVPDEQASIADKAEVLMMQVRQVLHSSPKSHTGLAHSINAPMLASQYEAVVSVDAPAKGLVMKQQCSLEAAGTNAMVRRLDEGTVGAPGKSTAATAEMHLPIGLLNKEVASKGHIALPRDTKREFYAAEPAAFGYSSSSPSAAHHYEAKQQRDDDAAAAETVDSSCSERAVAVNSCTVDLESADTCQAVKASVSQPTVEAAGFPCTLTPSDGQLIVEMQLEGTKPHTASRSTGGEEVCSLEHVEDRSAAIKSGSGRPVPRRRNMIMAVFAVAVGAAVLGVTHTHRQQKPRKC